ncbi:MAG: fructosamine kinase family protein [Saprospiraceae bacterium]|nr:fructosamine kinase family protein [Saprospiraceae bacterium]
MFQAATGGDIHESFIVTSPEASYFLKFNKGEHAYDMFNAEVNGLRTLAPVVATPAYHRLEALEDGGAYLLLTYYPPGQKTEEFWKQAGHDLARIHQQRGALHGSDQAGYLGTIAMPSFQDSSWKVAFLDGYLQPLVEVISRKKQFDERAQKMWEQVRGRIPFLLGDPTPSLLHGDLWSGNLYCAESNLPLWIDPSVRYGHREIDLAMTTLFGGFPMEFYEGYHKHFPEAAGWPLRESIYHLYPLFAHVAMFGLAYLDQAVHTMERILQEN